MKEGWEYLISLLGQAGVDTTEYTDCETAVLSQIDVYKSLKKQEHFKGILII